MNAIDLSVFASRMAAICEEMGAVLKLAAFSPNIKDRLDFSCAIFDREGMLCAQAAHIPVHLGSMAYAMRDLVGQVNWLPDDMVIVNDPYLGGTHLPDITLIAPVFFQGELVGFVVNRAHHADIGANAPGSMPLSSHLSEEGIVIPPTHLINAGVLNEDLLTDIVDKTSHPREGRGDFAAQMSANLCGVRRLVALIEDFSAGQVANYFESLHALNEYAERLSRQALAMIPDGEYCFTDYLDDDGQGHQDIVIQVALQVMGSDIHVDFSGTSAQVVGNLNCPLSVAAASVYYVFRCLMPAHTPACAGSFNAISLQAPVGCLLNARRPAAVAAGNVETSSRVVDVVMGALAQAIPECIPAASQGSMNNVAMGSRQGTQPWSYYETIGGGMGAGSQSPGLSAVQTHMTNTLNTPIESLEMHYPLRVQRYEINRGSGGQGQQAGGDGLIREFEFLAETQVTVLSERRRHAPWGLNGGESGMVGENRLAGRELPGKISLTAKAGERLVIQTPGGGGWGRLGQTK